MEFSRAAKKAHPRVGDNGMTAEAVVIPVVLFAAAYFLARLVLTYSRTSAG